MTDKPADQPQCVVAPERMDCFTWQEGDIEFIKYGKQPKPDPVLSPDDKRHSKPR